MEVCSLDYEGFKSQVFSLTKIDLNAYKERQMKRRIDALISKNKFKGYDDYVVAIKTNKDLLEEFVNYLTINVSEFYRNAEQWRVLEAEILPELMKTSGKNLKIWSAACSTGDEPYSLAMVLSKFVPLSHINILATDIDKQVLEKAKLGLYAEKSLAGLPKEYISKYFTKVGASSYQISNEIKNCVQLKQHNLLKDPYPTGYDLILCRNVLIYFTEEAKEEVYRKFNDTLRKGGVLFVGSTEQIIKYRELNYESKKSFFYIKL
ncbi:MAG: protein-glutamate O-methyltransferase CheR [Lachnospiraceae bacterium]|nr:protein-glutamate O-methyltransferase CheR [Lachnospiraceae bacterium]